ncbi:DUF2809 domain-containing protein [Microbacterium sp. 179-B 1A2 NHS]|uniref:ribosomal maturation YjgA family protein n=1 Tax=Microbacterium sp. 179-B 1A2 NHS TaxID=3142383 RepID=UPI0039A38F34
MTSSRPRRVTAVVVAVVAVATGLAVHLVAADGAASDVAGDALYVIAVWGGIVALAPRWPSAAVGGVVLAWCVGVELFQLTGLPVQWAQAWPPVMLALGTVFDLRDLVVYAITAAVITATDAALRGIRGGPRAVSR